MNYTEIIKNKLAERGVILPEGCEIEITEFDDCKDTAGIYMIKTRLYYMMTLTASIYEGKLTYLRCRQSYGDESSIIEYIEGGWIQ